MGAFSTHSSVAAPIGWSVLNTAAKTVASSPTAITASAPRGGRSCFSSAIGPRQYWTRQRNRGFLPAEGDSYR